MVGGKELIELQQAKALVRTQARLHRATLQLEWQVLHETLTAVSPFRQTSGALDTLGNAVLTAGAFLVPARWNAAVRWGLRGFLLWRGTQRAWGYLSTLRSVVTKRSSA